MTTVEGLIRDIATDLSMDQVLRRIQDPEGYEKIETLISKLKGFLGEEDDEEDGAHLEKATEKTNQPLPGFTVKLDDPAGNSFIEFIGSMADPRWNLRTYPRTFEQNVALGLVAAPDQTPDDGEVAPSEGGAAESDPVTNEEVLIFPGICSSCGHPLETRMKKVVIPYFKVRGRHVTYSLLV